MMRRMVLVAVVWGLAPLLWGGEVAGPQLQLRRWRVSAGLLFRSIENISIDTGTRSSAALVPQQASDGIEGPRADVGPSDEMADRSYDNGFVRIDPGTPLDGDTWYWAYQSGSQVNNDRLVFHAGDGIETRYERSTSTVDGECSDDDIQAYGPALQLDCAIHERGGLRLGLQVGLSSVEFRETSRAQTFHDEQRWSRYALSIEDRFDLAGVVPPAPPYEGSYLGPGPVIPNVPASRRMSSTKIESDVLEAHNEVSERLDLNLATLSMGISVEQRVGALIVLASAGPSLSLVSTEAERYEKLLVSRNGAPAETIHEWNDSSDEDEVKWGAFLQAGVSVHLAARLRLALLGRHDWTEEVRGLVGPSRFDADLNGRSYVAFVEWQM